MKRKKMYQTRTSGVFLLFFLLFYQAACSAEPGQSSIHTIESAGIVRTYKIYRPAVPSSTALPVMIVLHGGLGNADHIERSSGMNLVADTGPFIVVYPNGTEGILRRMKDRRTWNAGNCCGIAARKDINDVTFIQEMIEDVASRYNIDRSSIYASGMSNGAMMAYRLACETPELIAAIIPVSGTLAVDSCEKGKNVPVMHIHGALDKNVPFSGGRGRHSLARVSHKSVPETVRITTGPRTCSPPEMKHYADRTISTYSCENGAPFTLVLLKDIGHSWPGSPKQKRRANSSQFLASKEAWNFARRFSKIPGE